MFRIYLDSNVFSNLKSNEKELHQELNRLLLQYKGNLSFYFSQAHIRDKRNDFTNKKFEDFDFMESLVQDNYIAYDPIEKQSSSYLATPRQVHKDDNDDSVKSLFTDLWKNEEYDSPEMIQAKNVLKASMEMLQFPIEIPNFDQLPLEQKELMGKMLPLNKQSVNLLDWIEHLGNFNDEVFKDFETYRSLRKIIDEGLNNGKYTNNDGMDFNEAFKDSIFKKTFDDFVKDSLYHKDKTQIPYYDFYLQSYCLLDMFGISKEDINRKNGYRNIFSDGLHSYFARYCDVLVSTDKGLSKKSKALYELYSVGTKVLTFEEFVEQLPTIGKSTETDLKEFFNKLTSDYKEAERIDFTETNTGYYCTLVIKNRYLNAFDEILELVHEKRRYLFLLKKQTHWLSSFNYREEGMIVNKAIDIFGEDSFKKGKLNFEKELKDIGKKEWKERYWNYGEIQISLEYNQKVNQFALIVVLPEVNS